MKDPYLVLGLSENSSAEELRERYNELRSRYGEDRFLSGAAGNEAAQNLSDLESAWLLIESDLNRKESQRQYGGDFGSIDNLIKQGQYDQAQRILDAMTSRPAEWHYLQSIIFYKREWISESKAQLQMAVDMEPTNPKYRNALDKMNVITGNPQVDPRTIGSDNIPPYTTTQRQDGQVCGNDCSNCCMAYCLADCCCSMCQMC